MSAAAKAFFHKFIKHQSKCFSGFLFQSLKSNFPPPSSLISPVILSPAAHMNCLHLLTHSVSITLYFPSAFFTFLLHIVSPCVISLLVYLRCALLPPSSLLSCFAPLSLSVVEKTFLISSCMKLN